MSVDITIIKRDGRREPLDITKIQKMTSEALLFNLDKSKERFENNLAKNYSDLENIVATRYEELERRKGG